MTESTPATRKPAPKRIAEPAIDPAAPAPDTETTPEPDGDAGLDQVSLAVRELVRALGISETAVKALEIRPTGIIRLIQTDNSGRSVRFEGLERA